MGVKGGTLKDDANWGDLAIKEGQVLMLVGSAEELKAPEKPVVFIEDLPPEQQESIIQNFPPGLVNLGNTCYLNSGLQTLHHAVPEFRGAILRFKPTGTLIDPNDRISNSLKDLFSMLNIPQKTVYPLHFVELFRQVFPQFAQKGEKNYVQQDAEESWNTLLTALSQKVPKAEKGPPAKSVVDQLFSGEYASTTTCLESTDEPPLIQKEQFTKLSCHIKNSTAYLLEGLKTSLTEEIIKGSSLLARDAKWSKLYKITRLPFYLTIQFVRFDWRSDKNNKAKIVRVVDFPMVLDVNDVLSDELKLHVGETRKIQIEADDENRKKKLQEPSQTATQSSDKGKQKEKAAEKLQESPPENWVNTTGLYELVAVITHKGRTADSGHYVAWVRETTDMWLKYDDEDVSPVNEEEIKKLKGGGDWHMAYLLLYRSKNQMF